MLALHYILMSLKMHVIMQDIFKVQRPKKGGVLNFINVIIFVMMDVIRYHIYGQHIMLYYDPWLGMVLVIAGSFYLVKKIRLIPVLICVYILATVMSLLSAAAVSTLLFISVDTMFTDVWYSLFGHCVGLIFLVILCKLAKKVDFQFDRTAFTFSGAVWFSAGIMSYGFYVSNFLLYGSVRGQTVIGSVINFIALASGFISVFSIILSISKANRLKMKELQARHLEKLLEQRKQYEKAEEMQNEEIRKFKHDINEHLIAINELTKNNQLIAVTEYLDDLLYNVEDIELIFEKITGSSIIDANLHHLKLKYQHLDFDFEWEGVIPQGIKMSTRHLTDLFTNLLKNAFEAVSEVEGEKYISIYIKKDEQFLYINIKNNYKNIFIKDDHFETIKSDKKNHGFGLKTIKNIVAIYNGEIVITLNENEFEVEIIFENSIYKNSQ